MPLEPDCKLTREVTREERLEYLLMRCYDMFWNEGRDYDISERRDLGRDLMEILGIAG